MQVGGVQKLRVVLLAGLPLSGKTQLALKLRELGWDHIQHHAESNVESLQSALRSSLEARRDVVIDAKNLTKSDRHRWLSVASQTVPKAVDGSPGVSQFVVISAMNPTGPDAVRLDPAHLAYRQQYLSTQYTAALTAEKAVEYIHSVITALDPTFEVPYTTEGISSLAHIRTQSEFDQVIGWLSHATQFAMSHKPGWSTPAPSTAQAAVAQWNQAHGVQQQPARPRPAASLVPPTPLGLQNQVPVAATNVPPLGAGAAPPMHQVHYFSPAVEATQMIAGIAPGRASSAVTVAPGNLHAAGEYYHSTPGPAAPFSSAPVAPVSQAYKPMANGQAIYAPGSAMGQTTGPHYASAEGTFQASVANAPFNGAYNGMQQPNAGQWGGTENVHMMKQESGKRPYDHGPGASENNWNQLEPKRQAAGHVAMPNMNNYNSHQGLIIQQETHAAPHADMKYPECQRSGPPQPVAVDMTDPRPIILFELSGVLCNSTKDRMTTRTRNHMPRPGIGHLARLMPHFRIGVYSTAIKKTVLAALAVVSSAIRGEIASSPDGWRMLLGAVPSENALLQAANLQNEQGDTEKLQALKVPPEHKGLRRVALTEDDVRGSLAWGLVFDENLILHRDHTNLTVQENREITVKAVKTLFPSEEVLRRILVVDEPHFSQQDQNFIAMRKWDQDNRADTQIPALVNSLLAHLAEAKGDVRTITGKVSQDLRAAAQAIVLQPVYRQSENTEGYHEVYPARPGAEVCTFYLETGHCRFGEGCHFHHPPEHRVKLNKAGFPMHPDKPLCSTYLDTGFCDYGKSCMKHHPNLEVVPGAVRSSPQSTAAAAPKRLPHSAYEVIEEDWTLNFPQREGEHVCTPFTQNGKCNFGSTCKFHHPLDIATPLNNFGLPMRLNAPVCEYFCKTSTCRFGISCTKHHPNLIAPGSGNTTIGGMRGTSGGMRGGTGWGDHISVNPNFTVTDSLEGFFAEFASNPGKDICPHFKRTGHCKFGPNCMFDHPREYVVKLNMRGLPLRPGADVCKFYMLNAECGFGRQCMLHHPNIITKDEAMNNNHGAFNMPLPEQRWAQMKQPGFNVAPTDAAFPGGQTMLIIPQQQFQAQW